MNTIRRGCLALAGWCIDTPTRWRNVLFGAGAFVLFVMLGGQYIGAFIYNHTVLVELRAQAQAEAAEQALLEEHSKRFLPMPASELASPTGIPQAEVDFTEVKERIDADRAERTPVPDPTPTQDAPAAPTTEPAEADEEDPTTRLMPSAAAAEPTEEAPAATEAAEAFADLYAANNVEALADVTTPLAQSMLKSDDGAHPAILGQPINVKDVVVVGGEASATATTPDAMLLFTLYLEDDQWLVNDYMVTEGR